MKKTTIGIVALVGVLLVAGVAAAAPGFGAQAVAQHAAHDADRPMDGSNGPWTDPDDPRAEMFQERFGLTDAQMEQIRATVREKVENGADRTEVRATVMAMLGEFGVDDPALGPAAGDGHHGQHGMAGSGHGNGQGSGHGTGQMARDGSGVGTGPHGNGGTCAA